MTRTDGPEDLLVLARQCRLDEDAERRLEIALQSSRELELLYEAGVGFDAEASLLPGDETRSSALVARTLEVLDAANSAPRAALTRRTKYALLAARSVAASLAVGILCCVALASAWDYAEAHFMAKHADAPEQVLKHAEPKTTARADSTTTAPSATES
ncbi:MAG TPA: hypothetical protein VGM44_02055, partial [Polyangiaceae bacterium]